MMICCILVSIHDEVKVRCYTIEHKKEDFEGSLCIRYNLLQFFNQNEVYKASVPVSKLNEVLKLYPIVGIRKEIPVIALPPPIPLDLPKIGGNKKTKSVTIQYHGSQQSESLLQGVITGTVPDRSQISVNQIALPQQFADNHNYLIPLDFSDPQRVVSSCWRLWNDDEDTGSVR